MYIRKKNWKPNSKKNRYFDICIHHLFVCLFQCCLFGSSANTHTHTHTALHTCHILHWIKQEKTQQNIFFLILNHLILGNIRLEYFWSPYDDDNNGGARWSILYFVNSHLLFGPVIYCQDKKEKKNIPSWICQKSFSFFFNELN